MADQNSKVVKARRATIDIGDITINVYQLPDGSYRLSGRNVTDAIGEPNNSLIRWAGVKSLKALPNADSSLIQIQADTGESFIPISIIDALNFWGEMGFEKKNQLAKALVLACAAETIERRADRVFHIQRAEADYDAALKVRVGSIRHRKEFAKEIQDFCDRKESKSDSDQWAIKNATDRIYRIFDRRRLQTVAGNSRVAAQHQHPRVAP